MNTRVSGWKTAGFLLLTLPVIASAEINFGGYDLTGGATLGGRTVSLDQNSAKFNEYRSIRSGLFGNVDAEMGKGSYYLDLLGTDIGRDDSLLSMSGGRFESFKYKLYYNRTPHNYSFGATSFWSGVGTPTLTFGGTSTVAGDPTQYTSAFDYAIGIKDYGASVDVSLAEPFFVTLDASRRKVNGTKPTSFNAMEAPMSIDTATNNASLEVGYRKNNLFASVSAAVSNFRTANEYMTWIGSSTFPSTSTLPPVGAAGTAFSTTTAPASDNLKLDAHLAYRELPMNSAFTAKGGYSTYKNKFGLLTDIGSTETFTSDGVAGGDFVGDIRYKTANLAFTSRPISDLDTKVYFNYLKKQNKSSSVEYTVGTTVYDNEKLEYSKNNVGVDAGYRLPFKTKLTGGYEYLKVNREDRDDAVSTTDHKVFVKVKNTYFDRVSGYVKYEHLSRSSVNDELDAVNGASDENFLLRYSRKFDVCDKTQNAVRWGIDYEPVDEVELGLEYAYKKDQFNSVNSPLIGRTDQTIHEVGASAAWSFKEMFKLSAFGDLDKTKANSAHRYIGTGHAQNVDPNVPATTPKDFNWNATINDYNWVYGLGVEVPVMKDKLSLVANWQQQYGNGSESFTSEIGLGTNNAGGTLAVPTNTTIANLTAFDAFRKKSLDVKAVYKHNANLTGSVGFMYEKYSFGGNAWDGYQDVPPAGSIWLTGAYADNKYEAKIGYVTASYHF